MALPNTGGTAAPDSAAPPVRKPAAKKPAAKKPAAKKAAPAKKAPTPSLAERVKSDPALLAKALANPGLRAKLPDNLLRPDQLTARKENTFRREYGDITTPLSGDAMIRTAQTLVDREYVPAMNDLQRRDDQTIAHRNAEQGWAKTYGDDASKLSAAQLAGQQTADDAAVRAGLERRGELIRGIDQSQAEAQQRQAQDARVRGLDQAQVAAPAVSEATALAKQRAVAQSDTNQQQTSQVAGAQEAFMRQLAQAQQLRGAEQQGQIQTRAYNDLESTNNDRTKLRNDRDGKLTDTLVKLRGGEVDRYLTEGQLSTGLEKAKLQASVAIKGMQSKEEIAKYTRQLRVRLQTMGLSSREAIAEADRIGRQNIASGHDATSTANNVRTNKNKDKGKGPAGSWTTAKLRENAKSRDKVFDLAETYYRRGKGDGLDRNGLRDALRLKGLSGPLVESAVNFYFDKHVNSQNAAAVRTKFGVAIPKKYKPQG